MSVILTKIELAKRKLLREINLRSKNSETIESKSAINRISFNTIKSKYNLPLTNNSAVDGYAFRYKDILTNSKKEFKVVGVAKAGHPCNKKFKKNESLEIYTGAIIPKDMDCVVMHEFIQRTGNSIKIKKLPNKKGQNVRPTGENITLNEVILKKGEIINSADVGQLQASGEKKIKVYKKINVSVFSTGDEVVDVNKELKEGQIFDSNRPMLLSMLDTNIINKFDEGIVIDNLRSLCKKIELCAKRDDVIICSGGASDGIEDHIQSAIKSLGAKLIFWQLAIKPGKPMAIAKLNKTLIFCLPGNPVASFVCFKLLVKPAISKLCGARFKENLQIYLPCDFEHKKRLGRTEYLRCKVKSLKNLSKIILHGKKGAGVISSLTGADGLVEIPSNVETVKKNDILKFIPFSNRAI